MKEIARVGGVLLLVALSAITFPLVVPAITTVSLATGVDSGMGSVTPNCPIPNGLCPEPVGYSITVTAIPSPGWKFSDWSTQVGISCSKNPCTFKMPNNAVTLKAAFTSTATGSTNTFERTYGGPKDDEAYSVQQTSDGGYIVAGYTNSFGAGGYDAWVLKLNSAGTIEWQKTYGGTKDDYAYSVQQTKDGGYIVAGATNSFGAGGFDAWVLRLTSTGAVTWQKTYGGSGFDVAQSVQQTKDGGYIVAGETPSFGAGGNDAWVLKLDSGGSVTSACSLGASSSGTTTVSAATVSVTTVSAATSAALVASTSVTGTPATGVKLTVQC